MPTVRIGELYVNGALFSDEANQTIGQPGLSMEIFENRRRVTNKLTPLGQQALENVRRFFQETYGIDVQLKWNIYCGCSCPCSPGFDIRLVVGSDKGYEAGMYRGKKRDDYRVNIWVNEKGEMDLRPATFGFFNLSSDKDMHQRTVEKIKNMVS